MLEKIQHWMVVKLMNQADSWNKIFTKELDRRTIEAFKASFPDNSDPDFAAKTIPVMKEYYRTGIHAMLAIWLTTMALIIAVIALLVSIFAS